MDIWEEATPYYGLRYDYQILVNKCQEYDGRLYHGRWFINELGYMKWYVKNLEKKNGKERSWTIEDQGDHYRVRGSRREELWRTISK